MVKTSNNTDFIPALGYDWLTDFYDLTIKLTMPEKKFRSMLISLLEPKDDEQILEFGYGTGQNLLVANQLNNQSQYFGLDIDPKVRKIADKKLQSFGVSIPLDLYDGGTFPYPDNQFDKVFSSLVFHQLDGISKQNALNEIFRVLRPDGRLLIGDWGKAKSKLMRGAFYLVQLLDGFKTTSDNVNGLLPDYIMKAGFTNVDEAEYINTKIGTYSYYTAQKPS